jgi:hypothetical protein
VRKYRYSKASLQYDLGIIGSKLNQAEGAIRKLQMMAGIELKRKYDLVIIFYNTFFTKKGSETDIVKATVNIHFIGSQGCGRWNSGPKPLLVCGAVLGM